MELVTYTQQLVQMKVELRENYSCVIIVIIYSKLHTMATKLCRPIAEWEKVHITPIIMYSK